MRSGPQPRSIVRDDDEDDGGDEEAQRSLGQCMAEEWAETARGGTREDHPGTNSTRDVHTHTRTQLEMCAHTHAHN